GGAEGVGVGEGVRWVGPSREVALLYSAADVVALPALYEPFGNVHLEALAAGVPLLTSARAGGSEGVTSGANGWGAREPSGEAVAEGVLQLPEAKNGPLAAAAQARAEPSPCAAQAVRSEALYARLGR